MLEKLDISKKYSKETELFVREPVDEISRKIEDNLRHQIVLGGGRGSGKSIIIDNLENRNIGTEHPFIAMHFEPAGKPESGNEEIDERNLRVFCELDFCKNLLFYIRKYHSLSYKKYFQELDLNIINIYTEFIKYINHMYYSDEKFPYNIETTEKVAEIIEVMKDELCFEQISVGINRFDWTNEVEPKSQMILQEYFDLFDKVVITTDDKEAEEYYKKRKQCIVPTYGKDLEILKEIVDRRLNFYNSKSPKEKFTNDMISDQIYKMLIEKTDGNMNLIFAIISEVIIRYDKQDDLTDLFNRVCKYKIESFTRVKKMGKQPHLYI